MSSTGIPLRIALPAYHHTREIVSGAVGLAGVEPQFVAAGDRDADVVDLPLAEYLAARQSGSDELTAVPVFPARAFLHSWVHVREGGVEVVEEPNATPAIWGRGIAAAAGESGEVVVAPPATLRDAAGLRPLFERPGDAERADFAASGVYPILSVLAVRSAVSAEHRWLATNLYRAFEVARRRYFDRLGDIRGSRAPIPSVAGHVVFLREILGPDLCPYGVEPSRATLEAFVGHALAQGLIAAPPADVADLFAPVEPFVDFTDGI